MNIAYNKYKKHLREIHLLHSSIAALHWDKETYLPNGGTAMRGAQISYLSRLAHEKFISQETGDIIREAAKADDLDEDQNRNLELSLKDYRDAKKLPSEFVEKQSNISVKAFQAWIRARRENRYFHFSKALDELIKLAREEAEYRGYNSHPYDALLDKYEPGMTTELLDPYFDQLKHELPELISRVREIQSNKPHPFLRRCFDKEKQWKFSLHILREIGYDFEEGRQDISEHPFTVGISSGDVRITTRVDEFDFQNMLWSSIHEGGHALYEQNLPREEYGLPLGSPCSLAIHESQSRLWENHIGKSEVFWEKYLPLLKQYFPEGLYDVDLDCFYKNINYVYPGYIRTEADELHYHLHVIIRYEIEKRLIEGSIETADLDEIWRSSYRYYLQLPPAPDIKGILQDVHWSHGNFGYFPTYSLGSLYAAQFFDAATNSDDINDIIPKVRMWLQENIYGYGRKYKAEELCKKVTGKHLDPGIFIAYIKEKYKL